MRFRQMSRHDEDKLQLKMAPMIDVVFLLLIFFMCVSKWKLAEGNLAAELPTEGAVSEAPPEPVDLEKIIIKLQRSGDGVRIRMSDRLCPSFDILTENLKGLRGVVDTPVIIDADRDVLFRDAISALNASIKAEFTNVSFAAPLAAATGK